MLTLTSLLFGTNVISSFQKGRLFYAGLFVLLMTTSFLWHSSDKLDKDSMFLFWMDQVAIAALIVMSVLYASSTSADRQLVILSLGLIMAALTYDLGNRSWSQSYPLEHGTLHAITSLTGHLIVW